MRRRHRPRSEATSCRTGDVSLGDVTREGRQRCTGDVVFSFFFFMCDIDVTRTVYQNLPFSIPYRTVPEN
ncbi:unnamed protein product, partial [Musa textilis]